MPTTINRLTWQRAMLLVWITAVGFGCTACRKKSRAPNRTVQGPSNHFAKVTLIPNQGKAVSIRAELAVREQERETGLMFRGKLDPGTGMLFVFPSEEPLVFWMKNTVIPLDMIFVRANKTVAGVVKEAAPMTTTARKVNEPTQYVIEVPAGFCDKYGIGPKTKIRFKLPGWVEQELDRQRKARTSSQ